MNRFLLLLIATLFITFSLPSQTLASYGGPATGEAVLDKTILDPQSNLFVDNLNINNQHFLSDQDVVFRVKVTNVLNQDLSNVTIVDRLPSVLKFSSAPGGTYDNISNTVNFNLGTLNKGDSKTLEIRTKVKDAGSLQNGVTCHTNLSELRQDSKGGNSMLGQDTSTFCVSKQVLAPVQELPKTGPATNILFGVSFFTLAISAFLYKKSRA